MRILTINSVCGVGSTGRISLDINMALENENLNTCIAYGRNIYKKDNIKTYKVGTKLNVLSHVFETRIIDNHGFSSRRATYKLISFIKLYEPKVVHLHNLHGYYINIKILFEYLSNEFNGKVIWTLHDCWAFSGHSAFISDSNFHGSYETIKEYPKTLFFNFYKRNLNRKKEVILRMPRDKMTIITPSNWLADLCKSSFLNIYQIEVIRNGVDQSVFKYQENQYDEEKKKIILGVANIWDKRKGLDIINEVANILNPSEYKILVVGKVDKKIKLSTNIEHIEQTESIEELAKIYSTASVFINPTFQDNYPTTNLEALSCGIPVISFDTGGSGEVVEEKYLGKVISQGDTQGLIEAIQEYSENKESKRISFFAKKHSKEEMIEQYVKLIKKNIEELGG